MRLSSGYGAPGNSKLADIFVLALMFNIYECFGFARYNALVGLSYHKFKAQATIITNEPQS